MTYIELLRNRGVARLAFGSTLSRFGAAAASLAILLAIVGSGRSLSEAGAVLASLGIGIAVGAPVTARLVERGQPRKVLATLIVLHGSAGVGLTVFVSCRVHVIDLCVLALVLGATAPPVGPLTRSLWPVLVERARLPTAHALDSTLNSAMFVFGPAAAGVLAMSTSPLVGLIVAVLLRLVGDGIVATSPHLSGPSAPGGPAPTSPLADPRVRLLLVAISLDTFAYGALQVGAAGFLDTAVTTALITAFAIGEVSGGLSYGARNWPGPLRRHLVILNAIAIPVLAALAIPGGVVLAVALFALAGLSSGARDVVNQVFLSGMSVGTRSRAFAWLGSFMWVGYSAGTLAAGLVPSLGFVLATIAVALATAVVLVLTRPSRVGQALQSD